MILNDKQLSDIRQNVDKRFYDPMPRGIVDLLDTIADLKRQLRERDTHAQVAYETKLIEILGPLAEIDEQTTVLKLAQKAMDKLVEQGQVKYCGHSITCPRCFPNAPNAALDAYVQEKVDRAVLEESEYWYQGARGRGLSLQEEERISANRAKVPCLGKS